MADKQMGKQVGKSRRRAWTTGMPLGFATVGIALAILAGCAAPPSATPSATPPASPPVAAPAATVEQPPPSTAEIQTLKNLVTAQDRLYAVAAPLLVNNAELCRSHARNLLGFTAKNRYSYSPELANAARFELGMEEHLRVTGVLAGSGAARAGLRQGDALLHVNGIEFPTGQNAQSETTALLVPLVMERDALELGLLRAGLPLTLEIPLTPACAFSIEFGNADLVNAYGDGHRILITRGMLQAVQDDEELAYVIAKEMAHNILTHAARQNLSATYGGIIDNLTRIQPDLSAMVGLSGLRPVPRDFDTMADRLSFYLLARAGYKLERAIPFWRRLAKQYPASVQNAYTALHPSTERRIGAMEQALRDIESRRATGRPLEPAP